MRGWGRELLGKVGLPATRPRLLVLAALRGRQRPVTAQDLHEELETLLRQQGARSKVPGLTTVYRVLAVLAERGVLHCFYREGAVTAYRLCLPDPHDHLVCRCCGRVQEHPGGPPPDWVTQLPTHERFTVEDYHAELVGLCAMCHPDITNPPSTGAPTKQAATVVQSVGPDPSPPAPDGLVARL